MLKSWILQCLGSFCCKATWGRSNSRPSVDKAKNSTSSLLRTSSPAHTDCALYLPRQILDTVRKPNRHFYVDIDETGLDSCVMPRSECGTRVSRLLSRDGEPSRTRSWVVGAIASTEAGSTAWYNGSAQGQELLGIYSSRMFPSCMCSIMDNTAYQIPCIQWKIVPLCVERTKHSPEGSPISST